jgi:hypothetical protein
MTMNADGMRWLAFALCHRAFLNDRVYACFPAGHDWHVAENPLSNLFDARLWPVAIFELAGSMLANPTNPTNASGCRSAAKRVASQQAQVATCAGRLRG